MLVSSFVARPRKKIQIQNGFEILFFLEHRYSEKRPSPAIAADSADPAEAAKAAKTASA